jgi:virulence-associated protein VagC
MKLKVTKRGVLIPKEMLAGAEEVEVRKEDHRIVISPIAKDDSIPKLGENPVKCGVPDASEQHDKYIV